MYVLVMVDLFNGLSSKCDEFEIESLTHLESVESAILNSRGQKTSAPVNQGTINNRYVIFNPSATGSM